VLIIHGTRDKATVPAGSQEFHDRAGSKDKTLKLYDGHYHHLLNDAGGKPSWPTSRPGLTGTWASKRPSGPFGHLVPQRGTAR
jgi:hypothetical protein